jgi:hypothetical protein
VEEHLKALKQTMKMDMLKCQTVAGVLEELGKLDSELTTRPRPVIGISQVDVATESRRPFPRAGGRLRSG